MLPQVLQSELVKEGIRQGLVRIENLGKEKQQVFYSHANERFAYEPEEEVRLECYLQLVLQYKYPPQRIVFERKVKMGSSYRFVDIGVFADDAKTKDFLLVECKRRDVGRGVFQEAVAQAKSYDRQLYAEYLWVSSGKLNAFYKTQNAKTGREYLELDKLPAYGLQQRAFGKLSMAWWLLRHTVGNFFKKYVVPQTKKPWVAKFALFFSLFVFIGLMVSWGMAKSVTPFIENKTKLLQNPNFHFGLVYWTVPILTTWAVLFMLRGKLFPNQTQQRAEARNKKRGKTTLPFYLKNKFFFAFLIVLVPSLVTTELLFGYDAEVCLNCCAEKWYCWWSKGNLASFEHSWRLMLYFVPFLFGAVPQAFASIFVTWLFEAFSRVK
ncbi:type I restriction enzyme HsdR N-terminal domain-containing protein [Hugenholtzia roseola]|uniref:type I restriction enzyme HsdR N-terminal domain-containing protein n=1 Tax=Hugenholtzia roseola TaxID=1002 RepID=UPI0003F7EEEC|nr:type I restriction enzyme HsdR N-terminal domain-containing protein [Hugenholtzia roseola]